MWNLEEKPVHRRRPSFVAQRVNFRPNRFATLKIQIKIGVNGLTAAPQFSRGPTNLTLHGDVLCAYCIVEIDGRLPFAHQLTGMSSFAFAASVADARLLPPMHTSGNRRDSRTIERQPIRDMCTKYVSPSHTYTECPEWRRRQHYPRVRLRLVIVRGR